MHRRRVCLFIGVLAATCFSLPMMARGASGGQFLWHVWLSEDVLYIIAPEEKAAFDRLETDAEREQFVEQFWLRRDPTPETFRNEFKQEHYRRLLYAQERFSGAKPGWKTDRGRLYIAWGPPDEIESHPKAVGGSAPYELWRYAFLDGAEAIAVVKFSDRGRTGEYKVSSFSEELDHPLLREARTRPRKPSGMEITIAAVQPPQPRFRDLEAYLTTQIRLDQIPLELRTSCTRVTDATFLVSVTVTMRNNRGRATDSSEATTELQLFGRVRRSDGRIVESFDGEFSESAAYEGMLLVPPGIYTIEVAIRDPGSGKISIRREPLNLTCQ